MKWCFLGTCILENQTNKQLYWVSQSILFQAVLPYSHTPYPQIPGALWVLQGPVCAQYSGGQCEGVPDSTAKHLVTASHGAWCCAWLGKGSVIAAVPVLCA